MDLPEDAGAESITPRRPINEPSFIISTFVNNAISSRIVPVVMIICPAMNLMRALLNASLSSIPRPSYSSRSSMVNRSWWGPSSRFRDSHCMREWSSSMGPGTGGGALWDISVSVRQSPVRP